MQASFKAFVFGGISHPCAQLLLQAPSSGCRQHPRRGLFSPHCPQGLQLLLRATLSPYTQPLPSWAISAFPASSKVFAPPTTPARPTLVNAVTPRPLRHMRQPQLLTAPISTQPQPLLQSSWAHLWQLDCLWGSPFHYPHIKRATAPPTSSLALESSLPSLPLLPSQA